MGCATPADGTASRCAATPTATASAPTAPPTRARTGCATPTSAFVFATCQIGAERALKDELARAHPELRFAYSRPGFLTFKRTTGPAPPEVALEAVFARACGLSLGPADTPAVVAAARAWGGRPRLHVWSLPATADEEPPEAPAAAVAAAVRAAAPGRFAAGARARPGDPVLDVLVPPDDGPWWLGAHVQRADRSPWPGGGYPVAVPPDAPSRAYRKLEEALAWSSAPVRAGDVAVEIGSAPGGASYALLRRGLEVVGVDPGAMAPQVLGFEGPSGNRFRHLALPVGALRRAALPGRVDWLLLDVNLAPQVALHAVRRLVAALRRGLAGVLFTCKLNDWGMAAEVPALVARVAAMGLARPRATQLPSHRQEIVVYAETERAARRRR